MNQRLFFVKILVLNIFILISSVLQAAEQDKSYTLATATTGGTFYPVGVAIATLIKIKLTPQHPTVSVSAITSAGSAENVQLLRNNQAQLAILQGLYGAWAWHGEGPFVKEGTQRYLRSISLLWQNVEHFAIVKEKVKTGTMADLKHFNRAKFSIGRHQSGTEGSGRYILSALGIDLDNTFDFVYLGYNASANALQQGDIKGMNIPAGIPVSAINRAFAALEEEIVVLDFTEEQLEQVNRRYPLWHRFVIPVATYPHQKQLINTIAQPNFLAVHKDIEEEAVYLITKTIYDNLPFLHSIHNATQAIILEQAVKGLPIPLHPGAILYYQEVGLKIPENLMIK